MIKILLTLSFFLTSEIHAQQNYNKLNVKELDVTSRVNVTSTTKSSKPCPAMTETQRNAIATPLNGSCIYNTTTSKLNVYNGSVWKAAGGGVDNWLTATAYSIDDIVIESSKIYQCLTAHTSGTFATDLAALKWAEISSTIPVNLTGPITSVGNATSIASQTGTGSTFVVQNTPTLTTPNIGAATGTSLTLAGNISAYNYDKDNMLVNGNIENPLSTEWTCTVGTCTRTTTAGEFSKDTAALKVVLSAQSMNVSQTVTTPSGIQKQGYVGFIYRIPASGIVTPTVTITVDSVLQVTVPTDKLLMDGLFHSLEVPITFGSTDVKISFLSGSSTGSVFFDGVYLKQGLGLQNLQGDTVYTALSSSAGALSNLNKTGWISFTSITTTYNYAITGFTAAPNCWAVSTQQGGGSARLLNTVSTASTVSVEITNNSGATTTASLMIGCQKSGNDYLAASSNVYSQASANYSRTQYTPTFTGFGTPSSVNCYHSRDGEFLELDCRFTAGTTTSTEARLSLPNSLTASASGGSPRLIGYMQRSVVTPTQYGVLIENSAGYLTFTLQSAGTAGLGKANADSIGVSGDSFSFNVRIPISGWTNSNVIVGSFENVPTVPGAGARIDDFQVSFGTTNTTTVCSASPCFIKQRSNATVSITRASLSNYVWNGTKTYSDLFCQITGQDVSGYSVEVVNGQLNCTNCNSLSFAVVRMPAGTGADAAATLFCKGYY